MTVVMQMTMVWSVMTKCCDMRMKSDEIGLAKSTTNCPQWHTTGTCHDPASQHAHPQVHSHTDRRTIPRDSRFRQTHAYLFDVTSIADIIVVSMNINNNLFPLSIFSYTQLFLAASFAKTCRAAPSCSKTRSRPIGTSRSFDLSRDLFYLSSLTNVVPLFFFFRRPHHRRKYLPASVPRCRLGTGGYPLRASGHLCEWHDHVHLVSYRRGEAFRTSDGGQRWYSHRWLLADATQISERTWAVSALKAVICRCRSCRSCRCRRRFAKNRRKCGMATRILGEPNTRMTCEFHQPR